MQEHKTSGIFGSSQTFHDEHKGMEIRVHLGLTRNSNENTQVIAPRSPRLVEAKPVLNAVHWENATAAGAKSHRVWFMQKSVVPGNLAQGNHVTEVRIVRLKIQLPVAAENPRAPHRGHPAHDQAG